MCQSQCELPWEDGHGFSKDKGRQKNRADKSFCKKQELAVLWRFCIAPTSRITNPSKSLFRPRRELCCPTVKEKWTKLLPALLMLVFALSRIPGVLPQNFSAAYALAFCGGVYFTGAMAWWLPLGVMLVTDLSLNAFYYHTPLFGAYLLLNYAIYAALIGLGRWFGRRAPFLKLLLGGLFGALVFYLVTNTLSWLQDPASDDLGNVSQHAVERRAVHRAVRRGGQIDRARRVAGGKNSRGARERTRQ